MENKEEEILYPIGEHLDVHPPDGSSCWMCRWYKDNRSCSAFFFKKIPDKYWFGKQKHNTRDKEQDTPTVYSRKFGIL
ncbi:MAG: hypothetical protein LBT27_03270 [Prevotellaceae bacterium]|nr:hypothetical protein [Prevotellaceae bacterium]